jgi:hypothetical protein
MGKKIPSDESPKRLTPDTRGTFGPGPGSEKTCGKCIQCPRAHGNTPCPAKKRVEINLDL